MDVTHLDCTLIGLDGREWMAVAKLITLTKNQLSTEVREVISDLFRKPRGWMILNCVWLIGASRFHSLVVCDVGCELMLICSWSL